MISLEVSEEIRSGLMQIILLIVWLLVKYRNLYIFLIPLIRKSYPFVLTGFSVFCDNNILKTDF